MVSVCEPGSTAITQGVTQRQLTLNLITGGLGTGMFTLPWSMAGAGVVPGVAMTFLVVGLNAWTIMILVEAAETHQVFDLGGVLSLLPGRLFGRYSVGKCAQRGMNFMVWVVLMGSLIGYLIVMHDSASQFIHSGIFSSRPVLVTVAALIVTPLCFLDQKWLSFTSTVGIGVNVYLLGLLLVMFGGKLVGDDLAKDTCYMGIGTGSLAMLSALSQCVIIQMCVLPMYEELQDRTPARFRKSLYISFFALAVLFSVFASLGYLMYGASVNSNLLNDLPTNSFYSAIAQMGVIFVVAAVYPIMVIPMVAPIRNMQVEVGAVSPEAVAQHDLRTYDAVARKRKLLVTVATLTIIFISWVGAYLIDDLGVINVIDGAICVIAFTALAPGVIGLQLVPRMSDSFSTKMYLLILLGVAIGIMGLVFQDNYSGDLNSRCMLRMSNGTIIPTNGSISSHDMILA